MSEIFYVSNIPVPDFTQSNFHPGVEGLLTLMGDNGFKFYRSPTTTQLAGPQGLIASDDLVMLKINAQWKHRGTTNADVVRGIIQRILDHPDGFSGEVFLFENGRGRASFDCDLCDDYYATDEVAANAEDPSHTWSWLVKECFQDPRVSGILFDEYRHIEVPEDDHETQGYRAFNPHPGRHPWALTSPVFNTSGGKRVDFRRGVWTGTGYDDSKFKVLNVPILKTHRAAGVTGALKNYFGVISIDWFNREYHAHMGLTCAEMFAHVRAPDLNILDSIWVPVNQIVGTPETHPQRANKMTASIDPLALDYWAAKHILFPLSTNPLHNPDEPLLFRYQMLLPALHEFSSCGGCKGHPVTMDERDMQVHSLSL
jgi:hypothetical protein